MSNVVCSTCHGPKPIHTCGLCKCKICKTCAEFIAADAFSFLPKIPTDLEHPVYCVICFDKTVAPELESYNQKKEQAKNVSVFFKSHSKYTSNLNRPEAPVHVSDCEDYDDAIMRLAFLAVLVNCNALVDVQMVSKKINNHGYQSTNWSGTGVPVNVSPEKIEQMGRLR